ncbi:MAG: L-aspartate oxidase [Chloroflexi bacterium]|nr:L-aspartate oxidase [Chloroflexota bacterium]
MGTYDYLVIGSGIAGLYVSLLAQQRGRVLLVTKASLEDCNTRFAQGGIAAALAADDSPDFHLRDTLNAGAGLCDVEAVRILTGEGPRRIRDLIEFGVPFDRANGSLALTREAAHSRRRILHAGGDATGASIESTLSGLARQATRIDIGEHHFVTEIILERGRARGIQTIAGDTGAVHTFEGRHLILATGGAGRLYAQTTNPPVATGDGIALAYHAGAAIADLEFFQFHPTALCLPGVPRFLISEAVRGEGGLLVDQRGRRFILDHDPRAELAPRDVVARAILLETERQGTEHVYLDVTHLSAGFFERRFPTIYRCCRDQGIDPTTEPIPVTPAAHYFMGGVRTNAWGETTVPGLYAVGEVACTGVHGANRLASNSLLEVLVFGHRIVERTTMGQDEVMPPCVHPEDHVIASPVLAPNGKTSSKTSGKTTDRTTGNPTPDHQGLASLQTLMWSLAGIRRSGEALDLARAKIAQLRQAMPRPIDRETHEYDNLLTQAQLTVEAALIRQESRGAHYRTDFPEVSPTWQRRIVFLSDASTPAPVGAPREEPRC